MLNIILYVLYFVKYVLFLTLILRKEVRRLWIGAVSFGLWVLLCVVGVVNENTLLLVYSLIAVTALFFMIKGKTKKRVIDLLLTYTIINNLQGITDIVCDALSKNIFSNLKDIRIEYIISSIFVILLIGVAYCFKYRKSRFDETKISESTIYLAICATIWMVDIVITSLNFFKHYVNDRAGIIIMNTVEVVALFSMLILSVIVYYIYYINKYVQKVNENEREARMMQKLFYEKLLEKEEDTRKFRHDMTNQLVCVQNLLKKGEIEEVKNHMELLNHSLREIHEQVYVTGNDILDIMVNYYKDKLEKKTKIKILGGMSGQIKADSVEQCIIFSNVIKNAIEELNRGNFEQPFLTIRIENGDDMAGIIVENSSMEKKQEKGRFKTSKMDDKNHGIGLHNLKDAVKKCNGFCQLQYSSGTFVSKIYLPVEYK